MRAATDGSPPTRLASLTRKELASGFENVISGMVAAGLPDHNLRLSEQHVHSFVSRQSLAKPKQNGAHDDKSADF